MATAWDETSLRTSLAEAGFHSPVRVLEETVSTNADALTWADEGAPDGAVVVADHQTGGRGRLGRTWLSEPRGSLLFSMVHRPASMKSLPLLSSAIGVGVCEAIRNLTRLSVLLKWPNDLVIDERKLAGILVETRLSKDRSPVAVAGVGLNVTWEGGAPPAAIASRAGSIGDEMARSRLGDPPSRERLLVAVLMGIQRRYRLLEAGEQTDLVTTAESLSALVGREVRANLPGGDSVEGIVTGLDEEGRLELETHAGLRTLDAGEVETLRRSG